MPLAPSGEDGHLTLSEMIDDGASVAGGGASHVAGRVAGVINLANANLLHLFDLAHIEAALQGVAFAQAPSIRTLPSGLNVFREVVGTDSGKTLSPDGTSYVVSTVADVVSVATIGVPALVLPMPGADNWSSLEALAVLSTGGR